MPERFWLIWNPQRGMPTYQHTTEQSARNEAARLAKAHPDERFHVLALVATAQVRTVVWTEAEPEFTGDDIPFDGGR